MALNTTADWKAEAEDWMLERIRDFETPPLEECLWDEGWASIYYFFAKSEFNTENVDFMAKVSQFSSSGDMTLAKQIYDEHVSETSPAQVNLSGGTRVYLDGIFKDQAEPIAPPDVYDSAYAEIFKMVRNDSYARFKAITARVRTDLAAEIDWDNIEGR